MSSILIFVRNMKKHKLLGILIRRERQARALRQRDIARKLGRDGSWLVRIESGQRRVDVIEYLEIARAIGFEAGELLHRVDDQAVTKP